MVVVDHENMSFMVIDQAASQAMLQIEAALKNIPPDQRPMVEQMMKQRMPGPQPDLPSNELRQTGQREKRGDYPCVKYEVLRAGQLIRELWGTDWDNIEGGDDAAAGFEEISKSFRQMLSFFSRMGGSRGPALLVDQDSFLLNFEEIALYGKCVPKCEDDGSGFKRAQAVRCTIA